MNSKSKEDLGLARQKVIAEKVSDEEWVTLQTVMEDYMNGAAHRSYLDSCFDNFTAAHNIERGLRHER